MGQWLALASPQWPNDDNLHAHIYFISAPARSRSNHSDSAAVACNTSSAVLAAANAVNQSQQSPAHTFPFVRTSISLEKLHYARYIPYVHEYTKDAINGIATELRDLCALEKKDNVPTLNVTGLPYMLAESRGGASIKKTAA